MAGRRHDDRRQLGEYWLWYRKERDDWCICWYDAGVGTSINTTSRHRRTRRLSTGVGGGQAGKPPREAEDALAAHYLAAQTPAAQPTDEALVENIMAEWLETHAIPNLSDPVRYATSIAHWQTFFEQERRSGLLTGAPVVSEMTTALCDRFVAMRAAAGVGNHTISRDLAALRQPLNWMWKNQRLANAPFIKDVANKSQPRSLVYTVEEVAALLEAAWARPTRQHIHLFTLIMLSTNGRAEAVLGLNADQIEDGNIRFNPPGRQQTKKRRSIVRIAPSLAPWLEGRTGRVIQWSKPHLDRTTGKTTYTTHPVESIKKAFHACVLDAGIGQTKQTSLKRPASGPGADEPRRAPVRTGSPNTLRHTCSTEMHRRGVPEAQIETAAGHSGETVNKRNYMHLRPEYLAQFVDGVEEYWAEMDRHTRVHRR